VNDGIIIIPTVMGLAVLGYIFLKRLGRGKSLEKARSAARKLRLPEEDGPTGGTHAFSGSVDGMRVRLVKLPDLLLIKIPITTDIPAHTRIHGMGNTTRYGTSALGRGFITEDGAFDDHLLVDTTDRIEALAFLDAQTRKTILDLRLTSTGLEITDSSLSIAYDTLRTQYHNQWALAKSVRAAVDAAKKLERKAPLKDRLIAIIGSDPMPFIRLTALRAAAARYPADLEVLAAVEKSLNDQSLPVMLEAVRILGEKGTAFLLDLLIHRKGLRYTEVIKIVEAIAGGPRVAGAAGVLEKVFMKNRRPAVRKALLAALARLGDTSAGPFLTAQLERFDAELREGIIDALATCGTVEAVEKLRDALSETINPFTRSAIEKSIASIQSRLNADRGWLSVGETSQLDGALSGTGAKEGALSNEDNKRQGR